MPQLSIWRRARFPLLALLFLGIGYAASAYVFPEKHASVGFTGDTDCTGNSREHTVTVSDKGFYPDELLLTRCDTVIVENTGDHIHEPAFGNHPEHLAYPGFEEQLLKPREENRVVMSVTGTYTLHDHLNESLAMTLTVTE